MALTTKINSVMAQSPSLERLRTQRTQEIATGKRLKAASEDASGIGVLNKMRSASLGTAQAMRNALNAQSLLQTADSAMGDIAEMLQRIRQLSIQANNDTISVSDRNAIETEIKAIRSEIARTISDTEYNEQQILSNREPGGLVELDRRFERTISQTTRQQITPVQQTSNITDSAQIPEIIQQTTTGSLNPGMQTVTREPNAVISTTVWDHQPRWSTDGTTLVFDSTRSQASPTYQVPADASTAATQVDPSLETAPIRTQSPDGLLRLRASYSGDELYLERRYTSYSWRREATFTDFAKFPSDSTGFSFSPTQEENTAQFAYTTNTGNIRKFSANTQNGNTSGASQLIRTDDVLNIEDIEHRINLSYSPNPVNMNTDRATFAVYKVTDSGSRLLTYWDGSGTEPSDGYFRVSGNQVTFFGDAQIGAESHDDAADYYQFIQSTDGVAGSNFYSFPIPSSTEIYHMDGSDGPRSLAIRILGSNPRSIGQGDLLSVRPAQGETINGVYVNEASRRIEFYGTFRPSVAETVEVRYRSDVGGLNDLAGFSISDDIDTYNLDDPDLALNRSLRVYVGGREIPYDATNTQGYSYDKQNGRILLSGDDRPDVSQSDSVRFDFVIDYSGNNTDAETFGVTLPQSPLVYNLDTNDPKSMRVYRNGSQEVPWSDSDGYQFNPATRTVELYGSYRPDTQDTYSVYYLRTLDAEDQADGRVIVPLGSSPANYGVADPNIPDTFRVATNGQVIPYDATQTNGWTYNAADNRIEIFGDSRPNIARPLEVQIALVQHARLTGAPSPSDQTYDFLLNHATQSYGLGTADPKSIRAYKDGNEIPYDTEHGFSYDDETKTLSLHGDVRPTAEDAAGAIQVAWIRNTALSTNIPQNALIAKVSLDNTELFQVDDASGSGYTFDQNGTLTLVGDARPDATLNHSHDLVVNYYLGLKGISMSAAQITSDSSEVPFYLLGDSNATLLPDTFSITLNGDTLTLGDDYQLEGKTFTLTNQDKLPDSGDISLIATFTASYPTAFADSVFTIQTGANAGQNLEISIPSFDTLLIDAENWSVETKEAAARLTGQIDSALDFVITARTNAGATQNRLESIANNLANYELNTNSSIATKEETDFGSAMADLVRLNVLEQGQQAMQTHTIKSRELILNLIDGISPQGKG